MVYHHMMGLCQDLMTCLTSMYITLCSLKSIMQLKLFLDISHVWGYCCMSKLLCSQLTKCSVVSDMHIVSKMSSLVVCICLSVERQLDEVNDSAQILQI